MMVLYIFKNIYSAGPLSSKMDTQSTPLCNSLKIYTFSLSHTAPPKKNNCNFLGVGAGRHFFKVFFLLVNAIIASLSQNEGGNKSTLPKYLSIQVLNLQLYNVNKDNNNLMQILKKERKRKTLLFAVF